MVFYSTAACFVSSLAVALYASPISGRMVELGEPGLQRVVAEVVAAFYSEVPDNPALEGVWHLSTQ